MKNSKSSPKSTREYSSTDLNAALRGCKFDCVNNTTTINDFKIIDDSIIDGAVIIVLNSSLGDKISCQVIDKDNIFGYGINTILGQYVTDWYINPSSTNQLNFQSVYPAKLYSGLYLRTIYTSVGISPNPISVIVNYTLHKLLR